MTELFPSIQPEIEESTVEQLPMAKEVAWDFTSGIPIYSGGRPVIVTEAEAVKVWCWRALKTARFRHDIYTWDYGCEVESLVGRPFTDQGKESEAVRYVREALKPNPYIKDVRQVDVTFRDTTLTISCTVTTIYGEVQVHV